MCKKFIIFNFRGWSQPQKLNVDHALYVTLCTSTVSTATMDALRSLEKEKGDTLILLKMVLQNHSASALECRSDRDRGVIKSTQMIDRLAL